MSLNNIQIKAWEDGCGIPKRYQSCTFENYIDHPGSHKSTVEGKLHDTIFVGNVGTGKTHLACAKVMQVIEKGFRAEYIEMVKLIRKIKQSWNSRHTSEGDIISMYGQDIPFLVIDEVGVQYGSETEVQFLTEIINDRYNNNLKTFIITNMDLVELQEMIGDRVIDRFKESKRILISEWGSYRGKITEQ